MSKSARDQGHESLQLIQVKKPLSPLPERYGWCQEANGFDWPLIEANFNFTTMGRVVDGAPQFYMRPLPLAQLGYRPHPLAVALHDTLWEMHRLIQRTRHTTRTEAEKQTLAGYEARIREKRRQIWTATFETLLAAVEGIQPPKAKEAQPAQLSLL